MLWINYISIRPILFGPDNRSEPALCTRCSAVNANTMDACNLCTKIWKLSFARSDFVCRRKYSGDNFKANSPWIRWFSLIVGDKALFATAGYVFRCYSLPKSIVECLLPVQKSRVRTKYQGFGKTNRCMCDFNLKCCKKVTVRLGFEYLIIPNRHQCILSSCRVS